VVCAVPDPSPASRSGTPPSRQLPNNSGTLSEWVAPRPYSAAGWSIR
jgi:hypothetical protein